MSHTGNPMYSILSCSETCITSTPAAGTAANSQPKGIFFEKKKKSNGSIVRGGSVWTIKSPRRVQQLYYVECHCERWPLCFGGAQKHLFTVQLCLTLSRTFWGDCIVSCFYGFLSKQHSFWREHRRKHHHDSFCILFLCISRFSCEPTWCSQSVDIFSSRSVVAVVLFVCILFICSIQIISLSIKCYRTCVCIFNVLYWCDTAFLIAVNVNLDRNFTRNLQWSLLHHPC